MASDISRGGDDRLPRRVVSASLCRRHLWSTRPHGATVLTTLALAVATVLDITVGGRAAHPLKLLPIVFVAFGIGALNTTFLKDGEVSIPLSYVTGTLVKMGQGIERHSSGGELADCLGCFLLFAGLITGRRCWRVHQFGRRWNPDAGRRQCGTLTTGYTFLYADRRAL
jgi:uncharacterized membrane protein YoaK (UPF0700 family)